MRGLIVKSVPSARRGQLVAPRRRDFGVHVWWLCRVSHGRSRHRFKPISILPGDLALIAAHVTRLDHQQVVSISAGGSYTWQKLRFSTDLLYGSGLRVLVPLRSATTFAAIFM
jgi:hypothetical protein